MENEERLRSPRTWEESLRLKRERGRHQRASETAEEREMRCSRRRERDRERRRQQRASETAEERELRCNRRRRRDTARRLELLIGIHYSTLLRIIAVGTYILFDLDSKRCHDR